MSAAEAASPGLAADDDAAAAAAATDASAEAGLPKALLKRILKARLQQMDVESGGDGTRDFQINKVRVLASALRCGKALAASLPLSPLWHRRRLALAPLPHLAPHLTPPPPPTLPSPPAGRAAGPVVG